MENLLSFEERVRQLKVRLDLFGIDSANWGSGATKTIEHLQEEIDDGETRVIEENGKLIRELRVVSANVYCEVLNELHVMVEKEQRFANGGVRQRSDVESVGEKVIASESFPEAILRAMSEEIDVPEDRLQDLDLAFRHEDVKERESGSYPSLMSRYVMGFYDIKMPTDLYRETYEEVQDDKITIFGWKKVNKNESN